jgi:hypothetical protein
MNKYKKVGYPFLIFGVIYLLFNFALIPMMNASNTILNIIGCIFAFIIGLFTYYYVDLILNGEPKKETPPDTNEDGNI